MKPLLPSDADMGFPHILRVKASAGAGKTYLLAMRFVQFLLSDKIPHNRLGNLLAVTFTREATAEMKRRVLRLLKHAALGEEKTAAELAALVKMSGDQIMRKAAGAVDEIILNYDRWQVKTIDSFLYMLVQAASSEMGLSRYEELDEFPDPFYAMALDRLLVRASSDGRLFDMFQDVIKHYLFFQEGGSWWPRDSLIKELVELYEIESVYGAGFYAAKTGVSSSVLKKWLADGAQEMVRIMDVQGLKPRKDALKAIEKVASGDIDAGLSSVYWTKDDPCALFLKGANVTEDMAEVWRRLRELAGEYSFSRAQEDALPYIRLLGRWKDGLDRLKRRSRALFFSDIARYVKKMHDGFIVPEIVFRLGERICHYLIDEFQDTSRIQWQGLRPLIENALSQGGSLFCVGDVKQLLYRWRGSDSYVFEHGPEGFGSSRVHDLTLKYNWRSEKTIVDFVARVFDPANLRKWARDQNWGPQSLAADDFSCFSGAAQEVPPELGDKRAGGFVRIDFMDCGKDAGLPLDMAAQLLPGAVNNILERHDPADILILARDKGQVGLFTQTLCNCGIPALSDRQMDVRQDPVVRELVQCLFFLDNPLDESALSVLVTGRIFEHIWQKSMSCSPWEFLERHGSGRGRPLYRAVMAEAADFWNVALKEPFGLAGYLAPYEIAAFMLKRFDVDTRFPGHQAAVRHFLELLCKKGLESGLTDTIGWIKNGPDDPFVLEAANADAVRIMTIHKAKGLQARVVVIPFAGLASRTYGNRFVEFGENGLLALKITGNGKEPSPRLKKIYEQEEERAWLDELNVLYVALTRAREELHLFVPAKLGQMKNRLPGLLAPFAPLAAGAVTFGTPNARTPLKARRSERGVSAERGVVRSGAHYDGPWAIYINKRPKVPLTGQIREAARFGDEVHRLLSRIGGAVPVQRDPQEVEVFLSGILGELRPIHPDSFDIADVDLAGISKLICHQLAAPLFWPEGRADIFVEMEMADEAGGLFRMDRVVKTDKHILIGEFKTTAVEDVRDKDIEQVRGYMRLFSRACPGRAVRGLILYFALGRVHFVEAQGYG